MIKIKTTYSGEVNLYTQILNYYNNNLCIRLLMEDGSPFATLTKNLDGDRSEIPSSCAYVDINNCPFAEEMIKKYELGEKYFDHGCDIYKTSGFVTYPLYAFNMAKLLEHQKPRS